MATTKKSTPSASKAKKPASDANNKSNIILFWKIFFVGIGLLVLLFLLAGWGLFGALPDETQFENPDVNAATEIITSDGITLGKFYEDNRTPVKFEDLPQNIVNALVATEDERFFEHSGIDAKGTLRAVAFLGSRGGASTITQQLAKNFFTEPTDSKLERVIQKVKEWIIAIRLERQYTKEEIIAMYLNQIDFLYEADGVRSASRIYFNKEPQLLDVEESAVIVAMLKNPRQYNPRRAVSKDKSLARRNQVFVQMLRNDMITTAQKDSLTQLPIVLDFTPEGHNDGMGTYFREYLRAWLKQWIDKNPNPEDDEPYDLYRDGLKVYTTIDSRMQRYGENAVQNHMKNLQTVFDDKNEKLKTAPFRGVSEEEVEGILTAAMKRSDRWRQMKREGKSEDVIKKSFEVPTDMTVFSYKGGLNDVMEIDTVMTPMDSIRYYKKFLQTGMMSMEPQTGHVKAWIGGINHKHFKYDHVKKAKRQVGSTFKPFLYATAINLLHYSPCKEMPNVEYTIPAGKYNNIKDWKPKNSDGKYGNIVTLEEALANSINTISARLMDEVGPQPVIDLISRLGVETDNIEPYPSLALGTPDISLFEMVGAYGVFANKGIYTEPVLITRIEDKNGTVLYQNMPETKDVLSEETAYVTVKLMEGVTRSGSGTRLRGSWAAKNKWYQSIMTGYPYDFKNDIAGKTGTTQNQSDGWFMGMVPNLVTGVWVGGEDRSVHFASIREGQGASMALPIWGSYMKDVFADKSLGVSQEKFEEPEDITIITDCDEFKSNDSGDPLLNEKEETNSELDM